MGIGKHHTLELFKILHCKKQNPILANYKKTEPTARTLGVHRIDGRLGVGSADGGMLKAW